MNKMLVSKPVETDFLLERVEELLRIMKTLKLVNSTQILDFKFQISNLVSLNRKFEVERGFLLTCWHKIEKLVQL